MAAAKKSAKKAPAKSKPAKPAVLKPKKNEAASQPKLAPVATKVKAAAKQVVEKPTKKSIARDEEIEKLERQWRHLQEQYRSEKAPQYSMDRDYEAKMPLQHKIHGWGYVLKNQNNRIEVLFQAGVKILVTNYKSI